MKKIIFMAALVSMLASCIDGFKGDNTADRERDSLRNVIDQKDSEINDLMGTFNEIQQGFDLINEAEGRVNMMRMGAENNNSAENIVTNLQTENEQVKQQRDETAQIARNQDAQLNTAWYVFGTSKELKAEGILSKGEVLQGNYNKNYFTQIDIRRVSVIPLESKSASILTNHPAGSYTLLKDSKGQYTLRITDAAKFWSVSKYLVVKVK